MATIRQCRLDRPLVRESFLQASTFVGRDMELATLHIWRAAATYHQSDYSTARAEAETVLALGQTSADALQQAGALSCLTTFMFDLGEFDQTERFAQDSLALFSNAIQPNCR